MDHLLNGRLHYTGSKRPGIGERDEDGRLLSVYLPGAELVEAVNLAIALERPLLLRGEPGCGKTQLARAVAYEIGLPLETWYVKSTSRARDGLYLYDAVGRMRDAQLAAAGRLEMSRQQQLDHPEAYVRWGPLGRAFRRSDHTVVLIDEIDKADLDFPNDLLLELDERRFFVEETGQEIRAERAPIVFITSNDEKDLPDAFLRRCLFHYITFPDHARLIEIIDAHFPGAPKRVIETAVRRFMELRDEMQKDSSRVGKTVSTSELIDWVRVLHRFPEDDALRQLEGRLPYSGVLLKSWDDHVRYLRAPLPKDSPS